MSRPTAHVWLVEAVYRNGQVRRFKYHGAKAAQARADRLLEGRRMTVNNETAARIAESDSATWPIDTPLVSVTKSLPIVWPHPAGEPTTLDIPESE